MNFKGISQRNTALDIVRCVAVFSVVAIHFFLNNGFYSQTVAGEKMYIMFLMRTLFSVCVPLFMVLSGYLMCNKTLSKGYYFGIVKTLITYILASFCCVICKHFYLDEPQTLKSVALGITEFRAAPYSWYIEMYIGLFLLIPFLNIMYKGLESKKNKIILLITLITLTILPTFFNIFNFDSFQWWLSPSMTSRYYKLIPAWWVSLYPVTYYFTGAYLREYGLKIGSVKLIVLFLVSLVFFGTFSFYRSSGSNFVWGSYTDWNGFMIYILTVLLYVLLIRIKTDKIPNFIKFLLMNISNLSLGIYLVSWIFDEIFYPVLNERITNMTDRLPYFFIIVPLVFVCSLMLSWVLSLIEKAILLLFKK